MTRLSTIKLGYLTLLLAGLALVWWLVSIADLTTWSLLLVAAVFLLPGRIQGFLWRDFFRARRLLDRKEFERSASHSSLFLTELQSRPWLKRLMWLSWPGYSTDVEAMTLTNLGAARLHLGDLLGAEEVFRRAIALDSLTPLPFYNLGLLYALQRNPPLAAEALTQARSLGYSGGLSDLLLMKVASGLARLEGFGLSPTPPVADV